MKRRYNADSPSDWMGGEPHDPNEERDRQEYEDDTNDVDSRADSGYYDNPGERVSHVFRDRRLRVRGVL